MERIEVADEYFKKGFACAQAVLAAYCEELKLDKETALKIASGFGSGMGEMAETCGALTGAFMVIGLKYGGSLEKKQKTYQMIKLVSNEFRSRNNGNFACRDLLGADLSNQDEKKIIMQKKLFQTACPKFVKDAIEILDEVITP